jgi:hypothetical protein
MSEDVPAKGWRDVLPIHPAAKFPPLSREKLTELGEDIKKHGLREAIVLFNASHDSPEELLDGCNRLDALEAVGINLAIDGEFDYSLGGIKPFGTTLEESKGRDRLVRTLFGEGRGGRLPVDPWAYSYAANLHRRDLTTEQRDAQIRRFKDANPGMSIRAIAEVTKTPRSTVADALTRTDPKFSDGQVSGARTPDPVSLVAERIGPDLTGVRKGPAITEAVRVSRVTGRDGKSYPAKSGAEIPKPPKTEADRARSKAFSEFITVLHRQLPETLEFLVRALRDERRQIAEIPKERRVIVLRGYLMALGISVDDLRVQ